MASDPKHPHKGDRIIDASDLTLKDLTPEQVKTMIRLRAGALAALALVVQLKPEYLVAAGISATEATRAGKLLEEYTYADELHGPADKLAELIFETKLERGNQIANLLTEIAGHVRHRVDRGLLSPEIQAALQELLEYQYGPAHKAQLTRARKAKAKAPTPKAPAPEPSTTQTPVTASPATSPSTSPATSPPATDPLLPTS